MEIRGISFRTLASDGNAELGGKDWDDRLVNHVAEQFIDRFGIDPRDDPQPYQELYERCLHAKISLSTKPRAVIPVNYRGHRMVVNVSIEEFEEMTRDLVEQCADTCALVLDKAGIRWNDMQEVLLVGGSTRMPMIRNMLRKLSSKNEAVGVNPDECVALGAALAGVLRHRPKHPALLAHRQQLARRARQAARSRSGKDGADKASKASGVARPARPADESPPPDLPQVSEQDFEVSDGGTGEGLTPVQITDITSHPLGIVVLDRNLNERVVTLIKEGTPVPCEKHGRFAYAYDNMTAVRVEVTEGHGRSRDDVEVIGEVVLENLPPRPRGTAIDVIYRYNVNQILEVDVVDVETRAARKARISLKGGLSTEGLEEARKNIANAKVN